MNPLPPQAYTKETLVSAYQWLQGQSDNIKQLATGPDILVSLYLKAKLNGESFLDRPSIQNFKNELKSLASMMNEFEMEALGTSGAASSTTNTPLPQVMPAPAPNKRAPMPSVEQQAPAVEQTRTTRAAETPVSYQHELQLDPKSMAAIKAIREHMNLSSDMEALRLIVSVGTKRLLSL